MLEKAHIKAIEKHLPPQLHRQSMTGATAAANGTPDKYYDGWENGHHDLWIEYKKIDSIPKSSIVYVAPIPGMKKQPQGRLTVLQLRWLTRRWTVESNAWVIVGLPNKTALLLNSPFDWATGKHASHAMSHAEIAEVIAHRMGIGAPWTQKLSGA